MEYEVPYQLIMTVIIVAIVIYFVVKIMNNTPKYDRVDEGFYGGVARGSGHPDCLRTLPEGSQLLDLVASANNIPAGVSDASADYAGTAVSRTMSNRLFRRAMVLSVVSL